MTEPLFWFFSVATVVILVLGKLSFRYVTCDYCGKTTVAHLESCQHCESLLPDK